MTNKLPSCFRSTIVLLAVVVLGCRAKHEMSHSTDATHTDATHTMSSGMTMESSPGAAAAPYDLQFLDTMTAHHQGAVDMAAASTGKAEHAELKALVERIPKDQQKEIDQMKSWRAQWYPGAAAAVNMDMPGMAASMSMDMGKMKSMPAGHDYDLMFIDAMIPHHEGALVMSREALARAEHPEVKKLAQQIIDAQITEIEQMKKWKESWSKGHDAAQ